jgi:hypothetical protein
VPESIEQASKQASTTRRRGKRPANDGNVEKRGKESFRFAAINVKLFCLHVYGMCRPIAFLMTIFKSFFAAEAEKRNAKIHSNY